MKNRKNDNILKNPSPIEKICDIMNKIKRKFSGKDSECMSDTIDILKKIYSGTELPVAVAGEKLEILWRNPAAEHSDIFSRPNADFIDGNTCGQVCAEIGGTTFLFNVIKYTAESVYYIIEYSGKKSSGNIESMRNYFIYLSARIRDAAQDIAAASDNINTVVRNGSDAVANPLNRIDRQIMLLLNTILVPEQIYYNTDPFFRDENICIEQELSYAAQDAENIMGNDCEVSQNGGTGIFASMNKNTFEVITAFLTAEACGGEFFPERLEFAAEKISDERAAVSVRSVNVSGKLNVPSKFAMLKKTAGFFEEQLKNLMSERYGASFEKTVYPDGIGMKMEFKALPEGRVIVRSGIKYTLRNERFTAMASALAEYHMTERYKNITIT